MKCADIEQGQLLEKYLDTALPREQRDTLEFHIHSCIPCMLKLDELKARRQGTVAAEKKSSWKRYVSRRLLLVAIATPVVILLAVFVASRLSRQDTFDPLAKLLGPDAGSTEQINPEMIFQELGRIRPLAYRAPVTPLKAAAEARQREAIQLYRNGRYKESLRAFQEVLQHEPNSEHTLLFVGVLFAVDGDYPQAEGMLRKVVTGSGTLYRDDARFYLAKCLLNLRRYSEADVELAILARGGGLWAGEAQRLLILSKKMQ